MGAEEDVGLEELAAHHGHLGGFDVLGFKGGELLMELLGARRYFGLHVTVWCPPQPPHSCMVDGLQMATGCSVGKANLALRAAEDVRVRAVNVETGQVGEARPRAGVVKRIVQLTAAKGPEAAGRWAWEQRPTQLWDAWRVERGRWKG